MGSADFGTPAAAIDVPSVFWFFGRTAEETLAAGPPYFAPIPQPTLTTGVTAAPQALFSKVGKQ